jgi:hypothetical protein
MEVVVSPAARQYVKDHGGTVFVRAHPHHCCTGSLTLLDTTTKAPPDAADFKSVAADSLDVRFRGGGAGDPHQLVIELRGVLRRHPVAYWDGCAFKP